MSTNPISEELLAEMLANWREGYSLSTQEARMFDQIAVVLDRAADSRADQTVPEGTVEATVEAVARAMCVNGGFNPAELMANDSPRWRYYVPGARAALAALSRAEGQEPDAWEGYWPGAGSIDSVTRTTRLRSTMQQWAKDGAEITPLYRSAPSALPAQEPVAVKPLEWRVPTDRPDEMEDSALLIADGIGGHYAISHPQKVGPKFLLWWAHDPFYWTGFDTPAAAKAAAQADYEQRIRSALVKAPAPVATHRHKKRGTEYVLIGIGKMQTSEWMELENYKDACGYVPVDMRPVAIYQSVDDGSLWGRPIEEWEDGRFEVIAAPSQPQAKGESE